MEKKKLRGMTCCFTGHRALPNEQIGEIETRTEAVVCTLIKEKQVCYFGVGGAAGYDTLAAELLFRLRKTRYPHIKIILVVPFDGFTRGWTEEQRVHYNQFLGHYNKVVCAAACAGREAYLARNRRLVDASAYCVGYCTDRYSGTAYTMEYARYQKVKVYNVAENGAL